MSTHLPIHVICANRVLLLIDYILDTHTAVARTVAGRLDNDCPMIVASTAHFAKFADSVIPNVTNLSDTSTRSPIQMFEILNKLGASPYMHAGLAEAATKPTVHSRVCEATIDSVVDEIKLFLSK